MKLKFREVKWIYNLNDRFKENIYNIFGKELMFRIRKSKIFRVINIKDNFIEKCKR